MISKSFRNKFRNKKYKKIRRKTRKVKRRKYFKGGNDERVECCMCERTVNKDDTMIPRECLAKYGKKIAHRICKECWWDPEIGFAREEASHKCPGCVKGLPLLPYKKEPTIFIDLTEE